MSTEIKDLAIQFKEQGDANVYAVILANGDWLMTAQVNGGYHTIKQREILRRMAACWTACKGITTETLERVELPLNAIVMIEQAGQVAQERDRLLSVLAAIKGYATDYPHDMGLQDFALAEIAKVLA